MGDLHLGSSVLPIARLGEQADDFFVGGLREVGIMRADGVKRVRLLQADDSIGFAIEAVPSTACCPLREINMARESCPKFSNDHGVAEIRIGVRAFECIGASPPQDHPHIYLEIGGQETTILCPYCATQFRFDQDRDPFDADPPDSVYCIG